MSIIKYSSNHTCRINKTMDGGEVFLCCDLGLNRKLFRRLWSYVFIVFKFQCSPNPYDRLVRVCWLPPSRRHRSTTPLLCTERSGEFSYSYHLSESSDTDGPFIFPERPTNDQLTRILNPCMDGDNDRPATVLYRQEVIVSCAVRAWKTRPSVVLWHNAKSGGICEKVSGPGHLLFHCPANSAVLVSEIYRKWIRK